MGSSNTHIAKLYNISWKCSKKVKASVRCINIHFFRYESWRWFQRKALKGKFTKHKKSVIIYLPPCGLNDTWHLFKWHSQLWLLCGTKKRRYFENCLHTAKVNEGQCWQNTFFCVFFYDMGWIIPLTNKTYRCCPPESFVYSYFVIFFVP